MQISFSELRCKEVVNTCTGERYGYVCDMFFEPEHGRITAICVPEDCGCFPWSFSKRKEVVIPWDCIKKIGDDIILVDFSKKSCSC